MKKGIEERPILEILQPIARGGDFFRKDLRVMGGIATGAAINSAAQIDTKTQTVVLPRADFTETNIRANGSLRDIDALVLAPNSDETFQNYREELEQKFDKDLRTSIFGIKTATEFSGELKSPARALMLRAGDRYQTENGEIVKLLSPWAVEIPETSFTPWNYRFTESDDAPTMEFTGLNPANDLANRLTRTTILRPRDIAKVSAVLDLVENNSELSDWLKTGDGASQAELARIALSVRANSWHKLTPRNPEKRRTMDELAEKLTAFFGPVFSPEELAEHDAFLFRDAPDRVKSFLVGEAATVKAPLFWLIETGFLNLYQKLDMENWPVIRNFT